MFVRASCGADFFGAKMKKLIIWDFDGVISDTERLWITSRMDLLNRDLNLNWDFDTAAKHIGGLSDKDKEQVLKKLGICVGSEFWSEAMAKDMEKMSLGLYPTPNIEDIFKMTDFDQCIATGGIAGKTAEKIKQTGIEKYFPPEKVFTADLVKYGKPEPDLFLLAAETMGYTPENSIVIEDSVAGLTAAKRAKMNYAAFVKYHRPAYIDEIKKLGVKNIFDDMKQVKEFLLKYKN